MATSTLPPASRRSDTGSTILDLLRGAIKRGGHARSSLAGELLILHLPLLTAIPAPWVAGILIRKRKLRKEIR